MNEHVQKAWETLFAPPGRGSLIPGPAVVQSTVPNFADDAATLVIPDDTPEVHLTFEDAGAANTLTVQLPTSLRNVGKHMVLNIAQTADGDAICDVAIAGCYSSLGSATAANGIYLLSAVVEDGAVVWVPNVAAAIADVS